MVLKRMQMVFILRRVVVSEGSSRLGNLSKGPLLLLFNVLLAT